MPYINQIQTSSSQNRLEKLIAERLQEGTNKEEIDERIWDLFGETWAIMFTDLSGFSRSVADFGIIHFLQIIYESQRVLVPCIDRHDGILLKVEGDSMMVIFRQATKAVECAVAMQQTLKHYNEDKIDAEKVLLCVGLGYGKVLRIGDSDVFGAEVNAASKLGEDTADSWEILGTESLAKNIQDMTHIQLEAIDFVPPGAKAAFRLIYCL
jgi:adenylate cyclase